MSTGRRILIISLVLLTVIIVGAGLFLRSLATRGIPEYDGSAVLKNLRAEVVIYRDEFAIPHIYAKNAGDLYRATGYCMAQDRLWQMDLIRRATTGTLSEVLGADLIDADQMLRALRIPDKSRAVLARMDPVILAAAEAFADGVNQYLVDNPDKLPLEFAILGYQPAPWKPEHSLNLIGYMAWDLTMPWSIEVVLHNIRRKVGEAKYRELVPDLDAQTSVAYPSFTAVPAELDFESLLVAQTQPLEALGITAFRGSNNWVVAGAKSATGRPLFANDMHLGLSAPGIWYQMHQVIEGQLNVTGVALPGAPFVVAGHNDRIAWGMTNVMVDDMDFYLETINPDNPDQYLFNGDWRDLEVRVEEIPQKDGTVVKRENRFTHRGPIVTGFKTETDEPISMRWVGNELSDEVRTIYLLNRARNWEDFKAAVRTFIAVSQNIAYADVDGNIGLYCCAGVPIRQNWSGVELVPGATDEYDWKGLVPFEKLPHEYNPERGYVSSANNKSVSNDSATVIPQWPALHYRIDRIREMLDEKELFTTADFIRMHGDDKSKLVEELKPQFLEDIAQIADLNRIEREAYQLLKDWDGRYPRGSAAALIFEQLYNDLLRNVLADELGEELYLKYISTSYLSRFALNDISRNSASRWADDISTEGIETFGDCVQKSFWQAVEQLSGRFGSKPASWRWGTVHILTLEHPMGGVKILDRIFNLNRGPFETKGSSHTVGPYAYSHKNPYAVNHGASHRHIYDTADWDQSLSVIPTGVSGVPASRHYCDQTRLYLVNEYHNDFVTRELVEQNARYKLVLTNDR
ncbi:MAG: penicillin acylase family protein [Candidatus Neomarinimicrobiota bacterium]